MTDTTAILVLLGSFFLMIFLRFPIAYGVALSSVLCLLYQGLPLTTICQQMVKGHQLLQPDGRSLLYHHGLPDGHRRYF